MSSYPYPSSIRAGISVYIASEGLMPGQSFIDEVADKIKRGCRKTIIILSPDYNQCSWCNYEARLAHHKNPGDLGVVCHCGYGYLLLILSYAVFVFTIQ